MKILITGGNGFIGSSVIRFLINQTDCKILNVDKLTYAANLESLSSINNNSRYQFVRGDICNNKLITKIFNNFKPDVVMHLAAETHVDRSIDGPAKFIQTNIVGTYVLLECAFRYWRSLPSNNNFRFHHISTDEVYGSLGKYGYFNEKTAYSPNSPYSASKASSDHLVRAWYRTYKFPILITNCSNNYGPYQFPEKLIPLTIMNALNGNILPVYGNGKQIRDWLYVEDHARALYKVITKGKLGETYNIGGYNEKQNLDVVNKICELLDELNPQKNKGFLSYKKLIKFVKDRPGHDKRYAIDSSKIIKELKWKPKETFDTGLYKTVKWYLENQNWLKSLQSSIKKKNRLGLKRTK